MKISSYTRKCMCMTKGPGPLNSNSINCSMSISLVILLKVFLGVKTSDVEEIIIEKWYSR